VLAPDLLGLLFGSEYRSGAIVLILLMAEKVIRSIQLITDKVLQGLDLANLSAKATVLAVVVNAALNMLLVPLMGIDGAGLATLLSVTFHASLVIWYIRRHIRFRIPGRTVTRIVGAAILMGVVVFLLGTVFPRGQLFTVFLLLIGLATYVGITVLSPHLRENVVGELLDIVGINL